MSLSDWLQSHGVTEEAYEARRRACAERVERALAAPPVRIRNPLARRWCWLRTRHSQPLGGPCRCGSVVTMLIVPDLSAFARRTP